MRHLGWRLVCSAAIVFAGSELARADNWPHWRGPNNDGLCAEKNVPVKWSKTENVAWRLPMPGPAGSTPAVWDEKIFVTSAKGDDDLVLICVSTAGKQLWEQSLGGGNRWSRGDEGNMAAPSPSTDGKHVWAFAGNGMLGCFDFDGKEVWKFNVQDRYGKFQIQFGMTSTPVLYGDRLYLQLIHGDRDPKTREALVVALDKATGAEVWKQPRPSEAYDENEHSYASPTIYKDEKREFLITHGADYVMAHDLQDGHELWRCGGLHPKTGYDQTLRLVASPVAVPGLIVVPSAKRGSVLGLRPDGEGDITKSKTHVLWTHVPTPDVPSPVVYEGLVYLCRENGNLICLDAKTGAEVYDQEKPTQRGRHRASPVIADGNIYLCARDSGAVTVVRTGKKFEIVSVNKMDEPLAASPAFSNGRVYLRTFDALWAIKGTVKVAAEPRKTGR